MFAFSSRYYENYICSISCHHFRIDAQVNIVYATSKTIWAFGFTTFSQRCRTLSQRRAISWALETQILANWKAQFAQLPRLVSNVYANVRLLVWQLHGFLLLEHTYLGTTMKSKKICFESKGETITCAVKFSN